MLGGRIYFALHKPLESHISVCLSIGSRKWFAFEAHTVKLAWLRGPKLHSELRSSGFEFKITLKILKKFIMSYLDRRRENRIPGGIERCLELLSFVGLLLGHEQKQAYPSVANSTQVCGINSLFT